MEDPYCAVSMAMAPVTSSTERSGSPGRTVQSGCGYRVRSKPTALRLPEPGRILGVGRRLGVSGLAVRDTGLIGRDSEVSLLRGFVDPPSGEGRVLVLLGDAGMGKTALLADAARQARSTGMWVLSVTGREPEQYLAFAGLRQLLLPVLDRAADLPDRQTLLEALALSTATVQPDALLTGIAVLTVLSELAEDHPLLVIADNAQWLDRGSLDTLAFAARRLESEQLVLMLGMRGNMPPACFERGFPELLLPPLSAPDASRLLDEQPRPPRGQGREQVLAQAAGNPMALIELSRGHRG